MKLFLIAVGFGIGFAAVQGGLIMNTGWALGLLFVAICVIAWFGGRRSAYASATATATANAAAMAAAAARSQSVSNSTAAVNIVFTDKERGIAVDRFVPNVAAAEREIEEMQVAYGVEDVEEVLSLGNEDLAEKLEENA